VSYKSILTYVDRHKASEAQITNAIRLAKNYDATLSTIAYAASNSIPDYDLDDDAIDFFADIYEQAKAIADHNAVQVRKDCDAANIRSSVTTSVSPVGEWGNEFGRHARYSDLVVLAPINDESSKRTAGDALEAALYIGDVPVLICPPDMKSTSPETVIIGWNGSREALRSVRSALPALAKATTIDITLIDQSSAEKESAEHLEVFLSRHGINASISALSSNFKSVDETLRAQAEDIGAGMIVMGAYSHSWFREYFLGGVTKQLISRPPVPVLLAH